MAKIKTGFARISITPDFPVGLSGYGNDKFRISDHIIDEVELNGFAVRDEKGNTALMFTVDTCTFGKVPADNARKLLNEKFGIPRENITFSATHSHSGPTFVADMPSTKKYIDEIFHPNLIKAAETALNDLEDTEIYIGSGQIDDKMHFIRRYRTDENVWRSIGQSGGGNKVAHESHPDDDFQVIKFERKSKKPIILVNWAAHACFNDTEKSTGISADYPRYVRTYIDEKYQANTVFFQGAAGNVVVKGKLEGERPYNVDSEYATALVDKAESIFANLEKAEGGDVKCEEIEVTLTVDHSMDYRAADAKKVYDLYLKSQEGRDEGRKLAAELGFTGGIYHARDVYKKSLDPLTKNIFVYTVTFGDIAFACPSYEMFDTNGMQIKGASPFKMTFICEITNAYNSYIPSYIAYPHGGYEVTSCHYKRGSGELLADKLVGSLNKLKSIE